MALFAYLRKRKQYNDTINQLGRLSQRELADIGITKGDIKRLALEASERV